MYCAALSLSPKFGKSFSSCSNDPTPAIYPFNLAAKGEVRNISPVVSPVVSINHG